MWVMRPRFQAWVDGDMTPRPWMSLLNPRVTELLQYQPAGEKLLASPMRDQLPALPSQIPISLPAQKCINLLSNESSSKYEEEHYGENRSRQGSQAVPLPGCRNSLLTGSGWDTSVP